MITFREEDHTYWKDGINYPSVTKILEEMGFVGSTWFDEYSRIRGTYVHKAIELYNKAELLEKDLDERLAPYLDAWRRFKQNSDIVILNSELQVHSDIFRYAGKLDIECSINDNQAIVDLKSGIVAPVTALQLAAYVMARYENYYSVKRYGLSLKGGRATIVPFENFSDFGVWQAIMAVYNYKLNNGIIKGVEK